MLFSAHYTEVVQSGGMTCGVTVVTDGGGAFRCSLNLSPNVLAVSPMYSSSHSNLSHLNLYAILFLLCGLYHLVPPIHLLWSSHS